MRTSCTVRSRFVRRLFLERQVVNCQDVSSRFGGQLVRRPFRRLSAGHNLFVARVLSGIAYRLFALVRPIFSHVWPARLGDFATLRLCDEDHTRRAQRSLKVVLQRARAASASSEPFQNSPTQFWGARSPSGRAMLYTKRAKAPCRRHHLQTSTYSKPW